MSEEHVVSFSLEVNLEKAYTQARQYQAVLYRALALARRIGLPEDINKATQQLQRAIGVANMLRLTMIALQSTTPIGVLLGIINLGMLMFDIGDFAMDLGIA